MAKQIHLDDDSKENDASSVACGIPVGIARATMEKGERMHPRDPLAEVNANQAFAAGATNKGTQHEGQKATSWLQACVKNTKLEGLEGSTVDTTHGTDRKLRLPVVTPAPTMLLDASMYTSMSSRAVTHRGNHSSAKTAPLKDSKSSSSDRRQVLATIDLSQPVDTDTRVLKVTTTSKQSFLQNLDSMICDGSAKNSEAVHWACEGEAFVIDKSRKEDFVGLLNTYFSKSTATSFQRQLTCYNLKKQQTGKFKDKHHNPLFHRDRCSTEDLLSLRRTIKKSANGMSTRSTTSPLTIAKPPVQSPKASDTTASTRSTRKTRGMSPTKLTAPRKQAKKAKISFAGPPFEGASVDSSTGSGPDKLWYATKSTSKAGTTPNPGKDAQPNATVTAVVTGTNTGEEHQAKANNEDQAKTADATSPSGPEPIVIDDVQTAALSLYDEESLAIMSLHLFGGQEAGLPCADFCSAPGPEASFSLATIPPNPAESYPIHYPSRLPTTLVAHPPAHAYFIPIASSTDKPNSNDYLTNPVVNSEPITTLRHPWAIKLAPMWTDESNVHSPGHKVLSRRPSAENFANYWTDDSTSEGPSPVPASETAQTIASFLSREEELAQEALNAREVTPTCGMITVTLYDQNGHAFMPMSPSRGMISPIDPNVSQGGDSPMEAWFVDTMSPLAATGEQDSFPFASPMETDSVVDKRFLTAYLKTTDALQNQWCPGNLMHGNQTPRKGRWNQVGRFASRLPVGTGTNWVGVRQQGTTQATKRNRI